MKRIITVATSVLVAFALVLPAGAGGAWTDTVEDIESVVAVADGDNIFGVLLASMNCRKVNRIQFPDGSAKENQVCKITGPFLGFGPEFAGDVPVRRYRDAQGPCIWVSDYLANTTGEVVFADTYRSIALPSGTVQVMSSYGPVPLTEEDCGEL